MKKQTEKTDYVNIFFGILVWGGIIILSIILLAAIIGGFL